MPATILIVEDEKNTREGLALAFQDEYNIYEAANAQEAFRLMDAEIFDVILTDLRMAGKSGLSVIEKAMTLPNKPFCIMMTAYGNVETAVEAMKRGAYDFLTKPVNLEKLEIVIKRALNSKEIEKENLVLHQRLDEKYKFNTHIIGNALSLQKSLKQLEQVAPTKATVLLQGETGTGKELFAQMLHQQSPRARKPFIAVHCAALPANLLESELFGYEKGAFTGATQKRVGRFEAADGGTLFLDEIGEIDLSTQVKLLRFLETKTFEALGSSKAMSVDLRLICATNRNLEQMVKMGEFREDLYYRLNVIKIHLPSLRERASDIPILLDHYIFLYSKENGVQAPRLDPEAIELLQNYGWPGNIRELRNFCERLVILKQGQRIGVKDLEPNFHPSSSLPDSNLATDSRKSLSLKENEKNLFHSALVQAKGNRTLAAKILGISRRTLQRKLEKWPDIDAHE